MRRFLSENKYLFYKYIYKHIKYKHNYVFIYVINRKFIHTKIMPLKGPCQFKFNDVVFLAHLLIIVLNTKILLSFKYNFIFIYIRISMIDFVNI